MLVITSILSLAGYMLPFLFVLSLVVFFHELGHFLIGRWCGVKVETFSLGFGPELCGFNDRSGTRWRFAALPLGGYVRFFGDASNASSPEMAAITALSPQERKVSYSAQKIWKRAAIVAAGPIANFVLAIAIFSGVFYLHGRAILLPVVDSVAADSAAAAAGFQPEDRAVSINGTRIDSFQEMQQIVQGENGVPLVFGVDRGGRTIELVAIPRRQDVATSFGTTKLAVIGVQCKGTPENWHLQTYSLADSVRLGGSESWFVVLRTGSYIKDLISGQQSAGQLSGPIRIAEVSGEMAKIGLAALLNLAAVLSISVGLLNLLPIPLLDGGHLAYYTVEAIRGKVLNERAQQFGIDIGAFLLAALMFVATYNDVLHLVRQWTHLE
jgi:regulator of sigma E protease